MTQDMTSPDTPATEAGRTHRQRCMEYSDYSWDEAAIDADILAIEAEARSLGEAVQQAIDDPIDGFETWRQQQEAHRFTVGSLRILEAFEVSPDEQSWLVDALREAEQEVADEARSVPTRPDETLTVIYVDDNTPSRLRCRCGADVVTVERLAAPLHEWHYPGHYRTSEVWGACLREATAILAALGIGEASKEAS